MPLLLFLALSFVLAFAQIASGDGQGNSGPLAAANALIWLSRHGYPNLCPKAGNASQAQTEVARMLVRDLDGSNGLDAGTQTAFPLRGIERYINYCGYTAHSLKFQGVRLCPFVYSAAFTPQLDWMGEGIRNGGAECALIGWYEHDSVHDTYKRTGGRWLTVIGCQRNPYAKGCPVAFVVTDPINGRQSWLYLERLKTGKVFDVDKNGRSTRPMQDASQLYKTIPASLGSGTSILEGAVVFRLRG
jgi:hypothetical protein